jgi:predicted transposase YbfD/YdcC
MPALSSSPLPLRECFQSFPNPRREPLRLYSLWDVIGLTICATIGGCNEVVEIQHYGPKKIEFLPTFLDLENGIPSHDTIGRVFSLLNPQTFRECFATWVQGLAESVPGRTIAIDGKSLRGSFDQDAKPLHLIRAFATENRLVLTQQAVDDKSNEITAIPELLKLLEVKKAVVTIDAMGCQKDIAAQIQKQGGEYVLSLKENQPTLHAQVQEMFENGLETDFEEMKHQACEVVEKKSHGRTEKRTYHLIQPSPEWLAEHPEWKGLKTLGMAIAYRQEDGQPPTTTTRLFISSLTLSVSVFAHAVRNHWGIENQLHWVLDGGYREEDNRSRKDHPAENLAWIRRVTVSLLARDETKVGVNCKQKWLAGTTRCCYGL